MSRQRSGNYKPRACVVCHEEYLPRNIGQKACSPECASKNLVTKTCPECKVTFTHLSVQPRRRFCSRQCAATATAKRRREIEWKPPLVRLCAECGTEFTTKAKGQRFCSRKCSGKAQRLQRRKLPYYNARKWSLAIKGESLCRNCGQRADHLHHIIPRSRGSVASAGDVERNGIPLCHECHRGWHDHLVFIYRDRLLPHEIQFVIDTIGEWWLEKCYPYAPDVELRRAYCLTRGEDPELNEHRYHDRSGEPVPLISDSQPTTLVELHERFSVREPAGGAA